MSAINSKSIRAALSELSSSALVSNGFVSKAEVAAKLGISQDIDRDRLKGALKLMVSTGEAVRGTMTGYYRYVPEAAPPIDADDCWARVYRAARIAKSVFDTAHIMKVAVITQASANRDLDRLKRLGYVTEINRNDRNIIYQGTKLLRDTPEVPPMPKRDRPSMVMAREALAELTRLFLTVDVGSAKARKQIREQIAVLHQSFEQGLSQGANQ